MINLLLRRRSRPWRGVLVLPLLAACASASPGPYAEIEPAPASTARPLARTAADLVPTPEQVESLRAHPGYPAEPFVGTNLLAYQGEEGRQ